MNYLEAYLDALLEEERKKDAALAEALRQRSQEILDALQQPYRDALERRAKSEAHRGELTAMLARGDPAEAALPLALRIIGELIGDDAFYEHNMRALSGASPPDETPTGLLREEYRHLLTRIDQMVAYLGNENIPREERERAMPQFMQMDERSRELLRLLGGDPEGGQDPPE